MARNEEKANSMLNRWWAMKAGKDTRRNPKKRPYLASKCKSLSECEKWRKQILREIGSKVAEIQNTSLGEARIRELNDEINRLVREKHHWDKQILHLGGPNYLTAEKSVEEKDGKKVAGERGLYRYYGAAKQLPGVKDLFYEPQEQDVKKVTRSELARRVNADYYGFTDEDESDLLELEALAERELQEKLLKEWDDLHAEVHGDDGMASDEVGSTVHTLKGEIPSFEQVQQYLVEERKRQILAEFG